MEQGVPPRSGTCPRPGERLFVHMVGGKPANPTPRGFCVAPSWRVHGKKQSCFSCKLFLFHLCTSSPLKILPLRASLTHAAVVWGEETPYSKRGALARNRVYPANGEEQGWHVSRGELVFVGFTHTRLLHLHFITLARECSKGIEKQKILPECDLPLSELWPSVCLALSITVSCLTVCSGSELGQNCTDLGTIKRMFHGTHS